MSDTLKMSLVVAASILLGLVLYGSQTPEQQAHFFDFPATYA